MRRGLLVWLFLPLLVAPAMAREVKVGIGRSISPYVIPDELRGLEYDVAREALALEGHRLVPEFLPLAREVKAFEGGQIDAMLTQRPGALPGAAYSDVYVVYRNYAITLESRNLAVDALGDLAGKSVLAFQNAALYLGPEFKAVTAGNPNYREESRQQVQPTLLFSNRVDVVIADYKIFNWFAGQPEVKAKVDTAQPLRYHPLFSPTEYRVAFRESGLRDAFNRGLARLRADGEYDRIVARYSSGMLREPAAGSR